jgi:hypothetical protein
MLGWARLLECLFVLDHMRYLNCGGEPKTIAAIPLDKVSAQTPAEPKLLGFQIGYRV